MGKVKSFYDSLLSDDGENVWVTDELRRIENNDTRQQTDGGEEIPYTCTIEYCLIKQRHEYRRILEMIQELNCVYTGLTAPKQQKIREEIHKVLQYKPKYGEKLSTVSEELKDILTLDYNAPDQKETVNV